MEENAPQNQLGPFDNLMRRFMSQLFHVLHVGQKRRPHQTAKRYENDSVSFRYEGEVNCL